MDGSIAEAGNGWAPWRRRWRTLWATGIPRTVLGLAVTAVFGAVFVLRTDLGELKDSLGGVMLVWLAPAIALNFIDVWFQAVRLRALLRHLSPPPNARLFAALLVGIMGNNVLPMRMGMVLRAQYLSSRYNFRIASMLSVMAVEGFMDGIVLAALFIPILLIIGNETGIVWAVLVSGGVALGGLLAIRLAYAPRWSERLRPLAAALAAPFARIPVPEGVARQFAEWAGAFAEGVASVRSERSLFVAALATGAAWAVTAGVYYTVGLAFDLDVDWEAYLVLTAAINVSGLIQVSQGNIGPYEVVAAEIMRSFGVASGPAAAYAIVTHLVRLIPLTIVGLGLFAWHVLISPPEPRGDAESPA
ncbi:MAG: lysylphosphatidylglycerol synthase transmembrane domain-containing protein [Dehalococcoidia bacterium]